MPKRKKKSFKRKIRYFLALIVFGGITAVLGYNFISNIISIKKMNESKALLVERIAELQEEKEVLEADILKLKDSDYIARYVREKYLYSRENEVILKIDD